MGQRPLGGSGFVLRESTSGSAPSAGAQSPPLPAVTPAPELRCSLRPKGLYTAVLPTGKTRLLVPHLYRKLETRKATKGPRVLLCTQGVHLRTLSCCCSPCALPARPGPPRQVARVVSCSLQGPVSSSWGPAPTQLSQQRPRAQPPSPPVRSGQSLCVVHPRPPWEPPTLTRSPPGARLTLAKSPPALARPEGASDNAMRMTTAIRTPGSPAFPISLGRAI